ncbi:hypothetical protein NMY22_g9754 [Coprinellus aureogranulatus]|nr:hypothetical protein NMY22_g9754 [Coprinellus aureogranulatus]
MSANNSSYSDVTYSFANNADNFKKAFCVAPPDEGCPPWGPCPNTDVTGLGNEISIYITTVIYGVILCYVPWLKRPMLYAHLSILYSLVIAGTVSIAKHELTKADGIFVLICASSPASIYLWYLSIRSFWNANLFPIVHSNKNKTASESYEVKITRIITLGTFAWVLALLIITFVPSKVIKFSQPGCNTAYGTALWFNLAWELPVALQSVVIVVLYYVSWGIFKLWTGRRSYQAPHSSLVPVLGYETAENSYEAVNKPSSKTTQPDIITWTETILNEQFPDFMDDTLRICIVTLLQITSPSNPPVVALPIDSRTSSPGSC